MYCDECLLFGSTMSIDINYDIIDSVGLPVVL